MEDMDRVSKSDKGELSQLIRALRTEGVEKGEEEAKKIIEESKKEAVRIIDDARNKSEKLETDAHKKAIAIMERLESQLELALRDFLLKVKNELFEVVALAPLKDAAKTSFSDPEFMKSLIEKMLDRYEKSKDVSEVTVAIPEDMQRGFTAEWIKLMQERIDATIKITKKEDGDGFAIVGETGGMAITDSASMIELLRPFISEKFQYILDKKRLPDG